MRRVFLPLAFVCLFLTSAVQAQNLFTVSETETKAFYAANRLQVKLALDNGAGEFSAQIKLEILDTESRVIAHNDASQTIRRGRQTVSQTLDFAEAQDEIQL